MQNTQKVQTESILEYKIRICKNKDLYNLSYPEISNLFSKEINEESSPDTIRKWWSHFSQGYYYVINNNITSKKELDELEEKKIELEKERKKKQTITVSYNKAIREEARRELLFEKFVESIKSIQLQPPKFSPIYPSVAQSFFKEAILAFGDLHYGKIFESINNKYSEEILHKRMNELLLKTVDICNKEKINKLNVINVGDTIEGMNLRISQLKSLEFGFVDQVIRAQNMLVEWLNNLSSYVEINYYHVTSSNHSEIRPLGTTAGQFPLEDMERLISIYIKNVLVNNKRIVVNSNNYIKLKLFDYNIWAVHGHNIKNFENSIKNMTMLYREFIDYLIIGNYHHSREISLHEGSTNNNELLVIPSIMGSDEYSDSLGTGAKPGAKFYIFEVQKGKSITYNIGL